ncbi:hypothetical protein BC829DRAFT_390279 [Chytridium lagenaria]|nr:hypothetical protein BC829DRAFT_390279 [Chytridium lagenaria]
MMALIYEGIPLQLFAWSVVLSSRVFAGVQKSKDCVVAVFVFPEVATFISILQTSACAPHKLTNAYLFIKVLTDTIKYEEASELDLYVFHCYALAGKG